MITLSGRPIPSLTPHEMRQCGCDVCRATLDRLLLDLLRDQKVITAVLAPPYFWLGRDAERFVT